VSQKPKKEAPVADKQKISAVLSVVLTAVIALLAVFGYHVTIVQPGLTALEAAQPAASGQPAAAAQSAASAQPAPAGHYTCGADPACSPVLTVQPCATP
jgi:hypothetical protein